MVHSLAPDGKEAAHGPTAASSPHLERRSPSVQHVERVAIELRHHLGVDRIMFATDFPHIECDWPNTRPFAERLFADLPDDEAFRIAAGNTLEFFGLRDTPVGRHVLAAP